MNADTHFTHDELTLAAFDEPEIDARRAHLDACDACRTELAQLKLMLDQIKSPDVPEPADNYESQVWNHLSWRLRGEQKTKNRFTGWIAAAAAIVVAFLGGLFFQRPTTTTPASVATATTDTAIEPAAATTQQQRDRILLVVVGDHLDESERMLVEITNLTAKENIDVSTEQQKAEELLVSNRLYRRTALDRGEDRVATLLDELEPMLMQIAHGPSQLTPDELKKVQKRVETKELVFKLRVLRADVRATAVPHLQQQPNI